MLVQKLCAALLQLAELEAQTEARGQIVEMDTRLHQALDRCAPPQLELHQVQPTHGEAWKDADPPNISPCTGLLQVQWCHRIAEYAIRNFGAPCGR